jgi:ribosome-binding protein aMBF1 (putative translation factor)
MTNHPNRGKVKDWPLYIKAFRQKHGLSQVQLAAKLRVEETTVQRWEAGDCNPASYLKRALRDLERELTQPS